jgi:alpha-beta hydrolase superfamily lysophospholipase
LRGIRRALSRLSVLAMILSLLVGCSVAVYPIPDAELPDVAYVPEGPPKAIVLALHGFNDYRRAFAEFARHAVSLGYRVEAFDQQGFGENANRGLWPGNAAMVDDLRKHAAALAAEWPDTPLYVLGESMGAAVAAIAFAGNGAPIDGIVMSAPAVWGGSSLNPFYRAILMSAAALLPDRRVSGRGLKRQASDNIDALTALGQDPLVIKETRLDAVAGLVGLMDEAVAKAPALDLPVLVLIGERDEIVPPDVAARFVERIESERCSWVAYPDGWHLLLRDLQREAVWNDIIAWIEGREPRNAQACGDDAEAMAG